jgi:hypothetical protein
VRGVGWRTSGFANQCHRAATGALVTRHGLTTSFASHLSMRAQRATA